MRSIGILTLGFCVALAGFYITNRLILKSKQLKRIICFIDFVTGKIKYRKETVKEIINSALDDKDFSFLFFKDKRYDERYYTKICFRNKGLYIDDEQKKMLYEFFCGLGKTDLSGQIAHCKVYKAAFEQFLVKSDEENKNKIKLYPSLFILLGMLVVLILF